MPSIKITHTDKGIHHWEKYLMQKQERRLTKILHRMEINPFIKRDILFLFKSKCNYKNIIPLSAHPIKIFLYALIKNRLDNLIDNSTIIIKKS